MPTKSALGIFFRIPTHGKVKKRLANEIGEDAALTAYESMLEATIENVSRLKGIDLYGFYEGGIIPPNPPLLKGGRGDYINKMPLILQKGFNLGERMYKAIQWLFDNGYQKVSLIGTDSPDLPLAFIKDAFQKLDSYKLVIGPSEDGGYYLIGMKNPFDMLFKNIEWGSDKVLKYTVSKAHSAGISYFLLPEWYDIDDLRSLSRWKLEIKESAHL
jgi:rSAM/selenodomain-associated transferase 1